MMKTRTAGQVPAAEPGAGLDVRAAFFLAVLVALQFLPAWARGLTPFWGDLTYIHHPWRALPVQLLESGHLPLWNPYLYFGMPMAAQMQDSLFFPGTIPFFFFGFATATAIFHGFLYWLAGWLMFLWLRKLGLRRFAALSGALIYALGGSLLSRVPFLNHLAVLSLLPALLLFSGRPVLLALSLALAFFAGYPPFLVGAAVVAWALSLLLLASRRRQLPGPAMALCGRWALAAAVSLALSAFLLIPAVELVLECRRAGGMVLEETMRFGFSPRDLVQWVSPLLVPWSRFDPAVEWWKASYIGFLGAATAVVGLFSVGRRLAAGLLAALAATLLLILGDSNPVSLALWTHLPPLKLVRYPGNMSYLALPVLALLTAVGMHRGRRPLLLGLLALELTIYGLGSFPLASRDLFTRPGPLVRRLQSELSGKRYLLSPLALEAHRGFGVWDWKWRLYGLTNAPYRLRAGGNFGQPLVPKPTYDFMDFLYRRPSAQEAARYLPWAGVGMLLTPKPVEPVPGSLLSSGGRELWEINRVAGAHGAFFFDEDSGRALPAGIPGELPPAGTPLSLEWAREDRFEVRREGGQAGWVYVAEPRYPGWKILLEDGGRRRRLESEPALGAFQKVEVPEGPWALEFRYDPGSWRWGALLSLLGFMGVGFCGLRRVGRAGDLWKTALP